MQSHAIYLVDFHGHGHSTLVAPLTIASLAPDVVELLDSLSLEKATLVGHSMSGVSLNEIHILELPDLETAGGSKSCG